MNGATPHPARNGLARVGWALLGWTLHGAGSLFAWPGRQLARGSAACLARAYGRRPRRETR